MQIAVLFLAIMIIVGKQHGAKKHTSTLRHEHYRVVQLCFAHSNTIFTLDTTPSFSIFKTNMAPTQTEEGKMILDVRSCLDKRTDGTAILLEWRAFDPSSALRRTELRDISLRLLPQYTFEEVESELRATVFKKRSEILSLAKEKVFVRILQECQRMGLETRSGEAVTSKAALKKWYKEPTSSNDDISQITDGVFRESARWKEDMAHELMEVFGIGYDPNSIEQHSNNKGNGFFEKICTKALNNARADLRAIRDRLDQGTGPAPRIKRTTAESYTNGIYKRRKAEVSLWFSSIIVKKVLIVFCLFVSYRNECLN